MQRLWKHWRIIQSGLLWLAIGYALLLFIFTLNLENLNIVEETEFYHILAIYEIGFALCALFLFSQLFSEEIEEGMFKWLFSLPLNPWRYLMERWLIGIVLLSVIYFGSMLCLDLLLLELPWDKRIFYTFIPALMLGQLAMFVSILSRNEWLGMGVPLFYWTFEAFSRGEVTKGVYLFLNTFPIEDISLEWNRVILLTASLLLLAGSGWLLNRRQFFLK